MRHLFLSHSLYRQLGKISDHASYFKGFRFEPIYLLDVSEGNEVLTCSAVGTLSPQLGSELLKADKWCVIRIIFEELKPGAGVVLQPSGAY
jgi:hypothetical protein